jgi:ppGpp synthetase/RelA/SpoT-type nucleotidyltranferase
MKIPGSIRALYEDQSEVCQKLKTSVDKLLQGRLHERWHYESRVKTIESFTLKIESGRFQNLSALEDFFAATIVVSNGSEIDEAEKIASELFSLQSRRPKSDGKTHKRPDEFPFDDLRLHLGWIDDPSLPASGHSGHLFELQIKTFLQHAWSIATHDLIYKADEANWSKMRIAYQVKAMLEHAEISIQEAAKLSESVALAKTNERTAALTTFIALITTLWAKEDLPGNVRGLAENVMGLADLVGLDARALGTLLREEQDQGRGPETRNLSPYGIVLQTLFQHRKADLYSALSKKPNKMRVLIPKELEVPNDADSSAWQSAILV